MLVPPTWQVAKQRGVNNMNNKANNCNTESFEKNEFVEELIKENIQLSDTVAALIFENKRLRERIESIENFCKVFGVSYLNSVIRGHIMGRVNKNKKTFMN
jgi:nitrogenase subunit NifH